MLSIALFYIEKRVRHRLMTHPLILILLLLILLSQCTFLTYLIVCTLRFNRYEACFCFLYSIKKQIKVVDFQNVFRNLCTTLLFASFSARYMGEKVIKNLANEQISDEKIIFFENFSFKVKKNSRKFCSSRIIP